MIVKTFIEPPIENNNYLIIDEQSKEAALIDCSSYDENIVKELENYGATLKYILLTHGHFDHIAGIRNNRGNIQVCMHKADLDWVKNVNKYLPMFGVPNIEIPRIDKFIQDGDIIKLGALDINVIETAGHTQGGVCYLVENKLFSGDTLFREAVGRCDLEGGDFSQIVESIKTKLFTLPDKTTVYAGHGRMTSIEWEKEHNNFL
jgi:glyoxylase-like metal-dependent hydrolase (beta-lactamase superfamily II)